MHRLEAVRVAVLCGLLVGGAACKGDAPEVDFSGGGASGASTPAPKAGPAGAAAQKGVAALLPANGSPKGFRRSEPVEVYGSSRLFEAINGGAESYISYGFRELARATYQPVDISYKEEIVVEVYQMATPLAAFGIYSVEAEDCKPDTPGPGCSRGSDLVLWQGAVFAKLTTYDDSPAAATELGRMAKAVAAGLKGSGALPPGFAGFPKLPGSGHRKQYLHKDQNEMPGLGPCYRVALAGGDVSLWLHQAGDGAAAGRALSSLLARWPGERGTLSGLQPGKTAQDGSLVSMAAGGAGFVFRVGTLILVGSGMKERTEAESLARRWAAHLAAAKGGTSP